MAPVARELEYKFIINVIEEDFTDTHLAEDHTKDRAHLAYSPPVVSASRLWPY